MTEQTHVQMLNARAPRLAGQAPAGSAPLVTPAVQELIDQHPQGPAAYQSLARRQRDAAPVFRIHHLDNGPSLVLRSFESDQSVVMTEAESLNHYGPHRDARRRDDGHEHDRDHHHHHASVGWGIAKFGSSMGWTIFLIVLTIAFTLDCHPEFLEVFK